MRVLNLIAAVAIVVGVVVMFVSLATSKGRWREETIVRGHKSFIEHEPDETGTIVGFCIMAAGTLVLVVDAFRRKYQTGQVAAWFLSIFGLVSFGITALIYYAVWGRKPLLSQEEVYRAASVRGGGPAAARGFCTACVAATTEESAGNTFTVNYLFGTALIGASQPCAKCGSVIKTKWFLWLVPVYPMGKFRVMFTQQGQYISRKLKAI